jgi:hypothetical protein
MGQLVSKTLFKRGSQYIRSDYESLWRIPARKANKAMAEILEIPNLKAALVVNVASK